MHEYISPSGFIIRWYFANFQASILVFWFFLTMAKRFSYSPQVLYQDHDLTSPTHLQHPCHLFQSHYSPAGGALSGPKPEILYFQNIYLTVKESINKINFNLCFLFNLCPWFSPPYSSNPWFLKFKLQTYFAQKNQPVNLISILKV